MTNIFSSQYAIIEAEDGQAGLDFVHPFPKEKKFSQRKELKNGHGLHAPWGALHTMSVLFEWL